MRLDLHPSLFKMFATVLGVLILSASALSQISEDELRLGVAAYKNSRYEEAIVHFRKAIQLDSRNLRARMYLGTALMNQYIPGVDSPDNLACAQEAITQYQLVFDSGDSEQKANSAKGIAYLYLNMKQFDEAKDYYQKVIAIQPGDPEPYYSVGVIDWSASYGARMEVRGKLELTPDEHLNSRIPMQKRACDDLSAKYMTTIEEGMYHLEKALQLRPDYDDAMAYLNLLYRERADLECDDSDARMRDLKQADEWVDRTLVVKKQKAEKVRATAPNPQ